MMVITMDKPFSCVLDDPDVLYTNMEICIKSLLLESSEELYDFLDDLHNLIDRCNSKESTNELKHAGMLGQKQP